MSEAQATRVRPPSFTSKKVENSDANAPSEGGTIMLGPDGKPCRACTDFKTWATQMKGGSPASISFHAKMNVRSR